MKTNKFFNRGTEDYVKKSIRNVEIKKFRDYFDLIIRTENSVQSIVLTKEQLIKLEEEIIKFNITNELI